MRADAGDGAGGLGARLLDRLVVTLALLASLQALSIFYPRLLFPSVPEVAGRLVRIFSDPSFYSDMALTFARALASLALSQILSISFAILSGKSKVFSRVASTLMSTIKATPFASIALILFFFLESGRIPSFTAFLLVFPMMFSQMRDAFLSLDPKLEAMCFVYGIKGVRKLALFHLPSLFPALASSTKAAFPMVIKAVVSSEIIVYARGGVGRRISDASLTLDSPSLFALTMAAIALCEISQSVFILLANGARNVAARLMGSSRHSKPGN